jgi:hypothetical protein
MGQREIVNRLEGLWKDRARKLSRFGEDLAKQMLDGQGLDIALTEDDFRAFLQAQNRCE